MWAFPRAFLNNFSFRLSIVISAAILEEEETQIAGVATIINHDGITMKQTSLFTVTDIVDFVTCLKNAVGRYKQLYLVNLPTFASFLLDVARATLTEKLKHRMVLPKNMEDLKNYMDVKLLPKEYGGEIPEAEHMERFTNYFRTVRPSLEKFKNCDVDWHKIPDLKAKTAETVGSFRKLEID